VRLDHLLSRENRVSTLGGIEALMAPMVDRTVDRFPSQVGSVVARKGGGDRSRPGENHRNPFVSSGPMDRCHSSRVKGAVRCGPPISIGGPDGWQAKAPDRGPSERTNVRERGPEAGNAGMTGSWAAEGRLAQLVRALP
jgi:hypothetical protein